MMGMMCCLLDVVMCELIIYNSVVPVRNINGTFAELQKGEVFLCWKLISSYLCKYPIITLSTKNLYYGQIT